ncbi:MAG TPA: hypothetical protein P5526_14045 [Anaerolineae bacterium]|nr:hypothetical protein [Anaerolineae bacterium]
MTTPTSNDDLKFLLGMLVKQFLIWIPVIIGLVHQFLMFFFGIQGINVILDPPGTIFPFVTLELGWWLLLTLATASVCFLAYFDRIRPRRIIYPFYIYLIFLLVYVKPITSF